MNRISLCTCEKAAENGAFGGCFRHPFHHTPTHTSGRFNPFLGSSAPSAQRASTVETLLTFSISTLTLPTSPPSSEGPILAPRALSPKWTPHHLPCASSTLDPKRRRTIVLVYTGNGCAKSTASWPSSLWTASPLNKCEGYGVSHSINPQ
jgi:hypothetical protein